MTTTFPSRPKSKGSANTAVPSLSWRNIAHDTFTLAKMLPSSDCHLLTGHDQDFTASNCLSFEQVALLTYRVQFLPQWLGRNWHNGSFCPSAIFAWFLFFRESERFNFSPHKIDCMSCIVYRSNFIITALRESFLFSTQKECTNQSIHELFSLDFTFPVLRSSSLYNRKQAIIFVIKEGEVIIIPCPSP